MIAMIAPPDLFNYTDTYKLLFAPYVRIHNEVLAQLLYQSSLKDAIVNVYPLWDKKPDKGIHHGQVFLVLALDKIGSTRDLRFLHTESDAIVGQMIDENYPNYVVLTIKLDPIICHRFVEGEYSNMFNHALLKKHWKMFKVKKGGFLTNIKGQIKHETLSKTFHILTRSRDYERILAAKLGFTIPEFAGKLKELKSKITLTSEMLNLDVLTKQFKANGW